MASYLDRGADWSCEAFIRSLISLPGLKRVPTLAGKFTDSPVLGFRASRDARCRQLKLPKPLISIRRSNHSTPKALNTASTGSE